MLRLELQDAEERQTRKTISAMLLLFAIGPEVFSDMTSAPHYNLCYGGIAAEWKHSGRFLLFYYPAEPILPILNKIVLYNMFLTTVRA